MSEPNIRILGIAPYRFLPAINGGHKAIEQLYRNLESYAETIVVSTKANDETVASQYQLVKLFSNGFIHYINPFYFFKIKSLIQRYRITHVIMEHPYMGWLGVLLKIYTGVKLVIHSHNIEAMRFKTIGKWWWKGMWWYERWVYRRADLIFFITENDTEFAINNYGLLKQRCAVITYGIYKKTIPSMKEKSDTKQQIYSLHNIPLSHKLLLFNGDFDYAPNTIAVEMIISEINPLLFQYSSFQYTILICGRNLPEKYISQLKSGVKNIIYAGYVNEIVSYFLAADIFINPVTSGGGIKTKLVEALSYNCNCVSTVSGAIGVQFFEIIRKLIVVKDDDWKAFSEAVISSNIKLDTPSVFYDHFYWGNIAKKAINRLQSL